MSKTKWYAKPIYALVALALVLSLGIMAVPMAGKVAAGSVETQVAMLLDSSGSIGSSNWDIIVEGLASAVENSDCVPQDGTVELTVVRFASSASVVVDPIIITSSNVATVAEQIRNIGYMGGGTCMSCAFNEAADALSNSGYFSSSVKQAINLVTDGQPNSQAATIVARDNAITTLEMTEAQDEIDAEAIGAYADEDWLKDNIVFPQPGYIAPPFNQGSGWVRVVADADEFAETICEKFVVIVTPVATLSAAFSASPSSGPAPLGVRFTDESSGDIDSWHWDFGDGKTSTAKNPSNVYAAPGRYTVTLTVTGPSGTDTATVTIFVIPEDVEKPAKMSTSYLHISNPQVQPNQQVDISINVANTGGKAGVYNAVLYINGNVESSQMVSVAGGSTQNAVFHVTKSTPGAYQVLLEGEVGQFTVLTPQKTSSFGSGGLGTGGIVAIVVIAIALIVAMVLLFARTKQE